MHAYCGRRVWGGVGDDFQRRCNRRETGRRQRNRHIQQVKRTIEEGDISKNLTGTETDQRQLREREENASGKGQGGSDAVDTSARYPSTQSSTLT